MGYAAAGALVLGLARSLGAGGGGSGGVGARGAGGGQLGACMVPFDGASGLARHSAVSDRACVLHRAVDALCRDVGRRAPSAEGCPSQGSCVGRELAHLCSRCAACTWCPSTAGIRSPYIVIERLQSDEAILVQEYLGQQPSFSPSCVQLALALLDSLHELEAESSKTQIELPPMVASGEWSDASLSALHG